MSALKSAVMVNIQSHTNTVLEFPEVGIVRFHGNNSNGKSVLVKVLSDVVSNSISRPANRRSIIRRGHDYGELLMTRYDGTKLFVRLATEAAATYAELTKPDCPPIRRYLADKSIPLLVKEFGWHYDSNHHLSLNIHQDVDSFLFVDTRKAVNFDLLNSARSDQYAEASAESITRLLKASKHQRNDIAQALQVAQATYAALKYWDIEEEQQIHDKCLYLASNMEALDIPPMPRVNYVPKVQIIDAPPAMPRMFSVKLLPIFTDAQPDLTNEVRELQSLANGVCPTCQRRLVAEGGLNEISV